MNSNMNNNTRKLAIMQLLSDFQSHGLGVCPIYAHIGTDRARLKLSVGCKEPKFILVISTFSVHKFIFMEVQISIL